MFKENHEHEQESLFSPVKDLPTGIKTKLDKHWSTHFYKHVFTQIDERKFAVLYHEGYSRPNKPVNELVSLEIIKEMLGLSDEELEHAYLFDFRVRNALGKESLGDNICPKTFNNFRRRLLEFEEATGRDLLHEIFVEHRDYLQDEFDIDTTTQRMDSTFIDGNIKQLSRIDLIAKVVHNFLNDLPDAAVDELPAGMAQFADQENLELSYTVPPGEVNPTLETLVEHAAWLADRFTDEDAYTDLESFAHLERVLDEQCYRIPELEEDEDEFEGHIDDDDDDDSPGWEPVRTFTKGAKESGTDELRPEIPDDEADGESKNRVELKDGEDIGSDSLQNPHDDEATFRRKRTDQHVGYVANLAETCGGENAFRLVTAVRVETNNTDDAELLDRDVDDLAALGLTDLLIDGGYTHQAVEARCREQGITQHFTGITGTAPPEGTLSLAEFDWDGYKLLACAAGHDPLEQSQTEKGRISFRMAKEHCEGCEYRDSCRVEEKQQFYSFGFWERKLDIAKRRARLNDPASQEFLNQRAGAESMINEVYHRSGNRTKFTGKIKVKNATVAKAIGTNLKRVSRHLTEEAERSNTAA